MGRRKRIEDNQWIALLNKAKELSVLCNLSSSIPAGITRLLLSVFKLILNRHLLFIFPFILLSFMAKLRLENWELNLAWKAPPSPEKWKLRRIVDQFHPQIAASCPQIPMSLALIWLLTLGGIEIEVILVQVQIFHGAGLLINTNYLNV